MRIHEIHPGLLYQSGTTLKLSDERLKAVLDEKRIMCVVNLWHRPDPRVQALGRAYLHDPLPDGKLPPARVAQVEALAAKVVAQLSMGRGVLVHCHAGRNRSGLVNALVLRSLTGRSGLYCMQCVQMARPRALANPHFAAYLESLPNLSRVV